MTRTAATQGPSSLSRVLIMPESFLPDLLVKNQHSSSSFTIHHTVHLSFHPALQLHLTWPLCKYTAWCLGTSTHKVGKVQGTTGVSQQEWKKKHTERSEHLSSHTLELQAMWVTRGYENIHGCSLTSLTRFLLMVYFSYDLTYIFFVVVVICCLLRLLCIVCLLFFDFFTVYPFSWSIMSIISILYLVWNKFHIRFQSSISK